MSVMTKKEFKALVKANCDSTKSDDVLDTAFNILYHELTAGNSIRIAPLGTFKIRKVNAVNKFVPFANKSMTVPATFKVAFQPSENLKRSMQTAYNSQYPEGV